MILERELKKRKTGGRGDFRAEYRTEPRFSGLPAWVGRASRHHSTHEGPPVNDDARPKGEARCRASSPDSAADVARRGLVMGRDAV
jgi:hypothetical protein